MWSSGSLRRWSTTRRGGRVLLLAPEVERVLTKSGAAWMPSFIDLLQRKLTRSTDPAVQAMVATGLIGALTALFTA